MLLFVVVLVYLTQSPRYCNGVQVSSSGELPAIEDPPTFVITNVSYKANEVSPKPPLTIEVTVGDPAIPGLDLTGFEYELRWFAKGVDGVRARSSARQVITDGNDIVKKLPFSEDGDNGYKLGEEIYATFRVRYYRVNDDESVQDFSPWSNLKTSSSYKTGILVNPTSNIELKECSLNYSKIVLTLKTPINCQSTTQSCFLGISMFLERKTGSEFYWTSRQEVVLSTCQISLNNNHLNKDIEIYLKAICDVIEEQDDEVLLRFEFTQGTYFWNTYSLPDKTVKISDTLSRWCTYQGDPHMKTFDGFSYSFFGIGDYVLHKNDHFKLEVDVRLWPCAARASCICGVAIRERNDVLIFKGCNTKKPWQMSISLYSPSSSFSPIQVYKEISSHNKYFVFLSDGAQLIISHTYNPQTDTSWVNTMLRVTDPLEGAVHAGMCGNGDGIAENDLAYGGDGLDYTGDPSGFGNSWSLAFNEGSWFKKTPIFAASSQREMCSCGMRAGWWAESKPILATRCSYTEENFFLIISRNSEDITSTLRTSTRTRRAVNGDEIVDNPDTDGEFSVDDFEDYEPIENISWPTAGGLTESEVYDYCRSVVYGSSGATECQNITARTTGGNYSDLVESCVKDIQITDQKFWSSSALSTFQLQCEELIVEDHAKFIANETDTIQSDGTQAAPSTISLIPKEVVVTCPGDCSRNGSCVKGECICDGGRAGIDCSLHTYQIPVLKGAALDGLCDIRSRDCQVFLVNGYGFANTPGTNLTCHIVGFDASNVTWNESSHQSSSPALLVDLYQVQCNLPPHPVSRDKDPYVAGTPAVGMVISISNDGKKPSNNQTLVVYDGLCLSCSNNGNCDLKARVCLINGRCYAEDELHIDEPSKSCQPSISTDQWTGEPENIAQEEDKIDTTVIIVAGVVAPLAVLILLGLALRYCIIGRHSHTAEFEHPELDYNDDFFFHY